MHSHHAVLHHAGARNEVGHALHVVGGGAGDGARRDGAMHALQLPNHAAKGVVEPAQVHGRQAQAGRGEGSGDVLDGAGHGRHEVVRHEGEPQVDGGGRRRAGLGHKVGHHRDDTGNGVQHSHPATGNLRHFRDLGHRQQRLEPFQPVLVLRDAHGGNTGEARVVAHCRQHPVQVKQHGIHELHQSTQAARAQVREPHAYGRLLVHGHTHGVRGRLVPRKGDQFAHQLLRQRGQVAHAAEHPRDGNKVVQRGAGAGHRREDVSGAGDGAHVGVHTKVQLHIVLRLRNVRVVRNSGGATGGHGGARVLAVDDAPQRVTHNLHGLAQIRQELGGRRRVGDAREELQAGDHPRGVHRHGVGGLGADGHETPQAGRSCSGGGLERRVQLAVQLTAAAFGFVERLQLELRHRAVNGLRRRQQRRQLRRHAVLLRHAVRKVPRERDAELPGGRRGDIATLLDGVPQRRDDLVRRREGVERHGLRDEVQLRRREQGGGRDPVAEPGLDCAGVVHHNTRVALDSAHRLRGRRRQVGHGGVPLCSHTACGVAGGLHRGVQLRLALPDGHAGQTAATAIGRGGVDAQVGELGEGEAGQDTPDLVRERSRAGRGVGGGVVDGRRGIRGGRDGSAHGVATRVRGDAGVEAAVWRQHRTRWQHVGAVHGVGHDRGAVQRDGAVAVAEAVGPQLRAAGGRDGLAAAVQGQATRRGRALGCLDAGVSQLGTALGRHNTTCMQQLTGGRRRRAAIGRGGALALGAGCGTRDAAHGAGPDVVVRRGDLCGRIRDDAAHDLSHRKHAVLDDTERLGERVHRRGAHQLPGHRGGVGDNGGNLLASVNEQLHQINADPDAACHAHKCLRRHTCPHLGTSRGQAHGKGRVASAGDVAERRHVGGGKGGVAELLLEIVGHHGHGGTLGDCELAVHVGRGQRHGLQGLTGGIVNVQQAWACRRVARHSGDGCRRVAARGHGRLCRSCGHVHGDEALVLRLHGVDVDLHGVDEGHRRGDGLVDPRRERGVRCGHIQVGHLQGRVGSVDVGQLYVTAGVDLAHTAVLRAAPREGATLAGHADGGHVHASCGADELHEVAVAVADVQGVLFNMHDGRIRDAVGVVRSEQAGEALLQLLDGLARVLGVVVVHARKVAGAAQRVAVPPLPLAGVGVVQLEALRAESLGERRGVPLVLRRLGCGLRCEAVRQRNISGGHDDLRVGDGDMGLRELDGRRRHAPGRGFVGAGGDDLLVLRSDAVARLLHAPRVAIGGVGKALGVGGHRGFVGRHLGGGTGSDGVAVGRGTGGAPRGGVHVEHILRR